MKNTLQLAAILLTALITGGFAFSVGAFSESGSVSVSDWNPSDYRDLVGHEHNIFVGKVISKLDDTVQITTSPHALYSVRPFHNIKGNLTDQIVVYQIEHVEESPLLRVGSTYIFAPRYRAKDDVYLVGVYNINYFDLTSDSGLSDAQLIEIAQQNGHFTEMQRAYPYERTWKDDLANNLAYNSYASRCLDANGDLIDDTVQLANEKKGLPKAECVTPLKAGEPSPGWIIETESPKAGQKFLLGFAALVILASAALTAFVIRHAVKRTA